MNTVVARIDQPEGSFPTAFSDEFIEQVAAGSPTHIAKWVESTAHEHNVRLRTSFTDRFAESVSRLSDAEIDLDHVELLLLALSQAHLVTPFQRGLLHVRYLK